MSARARAEPGGHFHITCISLDDLQNARRISSTFIRALYAFILVKFRQFILAPKSPILIRFGNIVGRDTPLKK